MSLMLVYCACKFPCSCRSPSSSQSRTLCRFDVCCEQSRTCYFSFQMPSGKHVFGCNPNPNGQGSPTIWCWCAGEGYSTPIAELLKVEMLKIIILQYVVFFFSQEPFLISVLITQVRLLPASPLDSLSLRVRCFAKMQEVMIGMNILIISILHLFHRQLLLPSYWLLLARRTLIEISILHLHYLDTTVESRVLSV